MAFTKFILDSKNRFNIKECPCGKSNKDGKFVPIKGYSKFGYCHACAKNYFPVQAELKERPGNVTVYAKNTLHKIAYMPHCYLLQSLLSHRSNNLTLFLKIRFGEAISKLLVNEYKIGNSKQWPGANIFWLIDKEERIRTGKIMLYNKQTGKRIKEPFSHITWVHNKLKISNENIDKCLFGEHLLGKYPYKHIAIVESEKTAIVASLYFPQFIWMATGGIGNLSFKKLNVLMGRGVILFPDLGALDLWQEKANSFSKWIKITVSDYLQRNALDIHKNMKYDLADYLLNFDLKKFSTV